MRNYKYYNRNPKGLHLKDCVCRAISAATGLHYDAVNNLLRITASEYECEELCVCCYHHLLGEILCYPIVKCDFKHTVADIASNYPKSTLIIRVKEHLTTSNNGVILDIWDCSDELVDCFWIV
jgi:hypothetical protein